MNRYSRAVLLITLLVLDGCAAQVARRDEWPRDLPGQDYFRVVYAADVSNSVLQSEEQYLAWVRRFYEGSELYPYGYDDIESFVLDGLDGEARTAIADQLRAIGMQIGAEWAKDRRVKLISTKMLSVWADAIQSDESAQDLATVLNRISADVGAVLAGSLDLSVVTPDRYNPGFSTALLTSLPPD